MPRAPADLATFEANATKVADILRALANERRLMVLCKLVEWGEASVSSLAEAVGLCLGDDGRRGAHEQRPCQ